MRRTLPLLFCVALAGVPAARAADDSSLEQQVRALTEMVHALQQRVDRLDGRPTAAQGAPAAPPSAPAAPPSAPAPVAASPIGASSGYLSPEAALRGSWAKVRQDLDQAEVARLLGEPSKKFTLDGRTVWYYYYPATGTGSVFFTDAGRVSSRQSPFGWGW